MNTELDAMNDRAISDELYWRVIRLTDSVPTVWLGVWTLSRACRNRPGISVVRYNVDPFGMGRLSIDRDIGMDIENAFDRDDCVELLHDLRRIMMLDDLSKVYDCSDK